MTHTVSPDDLLPFNAFADHHPIEIDIVYAKPDHPHNLFGQLYPAGTDIMWGHKDILQITLIAAHLCHRAYGWMLSLKDCYRPVDAQRKMQDFNVHPSLLSAPGQGGHPRGMAIDIVPLDHNGHTVDMGTPFDYFAPDPDRHNPAARNFTDLPHEVIQNRTQLQNAMCDAARRCDLDILPLPQEWWDFRFMPAVVRAHSPIDENDLYPFQRVMRSTTKWNFAILSDQYSAEITENIKEIERKTLLSLEKDENRE